MFWDFHLGTCDVVLALVCSTMGPSRRCSDFYSKHHQCAVVLHEWRVAHRRIVRQTLCLVEVIKWYLRRSLPGNLRLLGFKAQRTDESYKACSYLTRYTQKLSLEEAGIVVGREVCGPPVYTLTHTGLQRADTFALLVLCASIRTSQLQQVEPLVLRSVLCCGLFAC